MSGPAGVIQWSDVVCSAPFLHARYPVGEHSCEAEEERGSVPVGWDSSQVGWALPELTQPHRFHLCSASRCKGHRYVMLPSQ